MMIITSTPIQVIMIFAWVKYSRVTYGSYVYPRWAEALGWMMTMFVVVCLLLPIVYMSITNKHEDVSTT